MECFIFKPYEAIPLSECKLEEELTCDVSLAEETESSKKIENKTK